MAGADILVDSAGFLALWDAGDEHHGAAVTLQQDLARKSRRFLTTEYIVDETVTLLLVRHSHAAAVDFGYGCKERIVAIGMDRSATLPRGERMVSQTFR